jgi:4-diphosphocytidyl-2-C-methyl-D-erythritol kinase
MYSIDFCDLLEIQSSDRFSITYSGWSIEGDELVNQMAQWLIDKKWISPIKIHLHKRIPIGSGLGGGSSDLASFTKYALEADGFKGDNHVVLDKMKAMSSDSHFFFEENKAIVSGKGDKLESFDLNIKGLHLLMVMPGFNIDTKEAYQSVKCESKELDLFKNQLRNMQQWPRELLNDFEDLFIMKYPEYTALKRELYKEGALYVSLSGSGSAFYALFSERKDIILNKDLSTNWIAL